MGNQVLWNKAMEKLKTDKSEFSLEEICNAAKLAGREHRLGHIDDNVLAQIKNDLVIRRKYDAVSIWVGSGGLIEREPEFVTELVGMFGIKE